MLIFRQERFDSSAQAFFPVGLKRFFFSDIPKTRRSDRMENFNQINGVNLDDSLHKCVSSVMNK